MDIKIKQLSDDYQKSIGRTNDLVSRNKLLKERINQIRKEVNNVKQYNL